MFDFDHQKPDKQFDFHRAGFYEEMYGENYTLLWPVTPEQFEAWVNWKSGCELTVKSGSAFRGRCVDIPEHGQVIGLRYWNRKAPLDRCRDQAILVHEIFHATCHTLEQRGVGFDSNTSNEPFAYLMQRISMFCFQALAQRKVSNGTK